MIKNLSKGQVGLFLLVIMGVVVALVMSVASRSLSDTVLSRQEQESSAAFSVAETGIETALNAIKNPVNGQLSGPLTGLADFVSGDYAVTPSTAYGLYVKEGEIAHLDLTSYVPSLTIAWTKKSDETENVATCSEGSGLSPAALEVSAIGETSVSRTYYNSAGCTLVSNGFLSSSDGGSEYLSVVNPYTVPVGTTSIRIKPVYGGATISVSGEGLLTQLYLIQSGATGGDARKEIEVKRGLETSPSVFDYAVFSTGNVVK